MDEEQWRPVPGHEGRYEISSHGRVKSVARVVTFFGSYSRPIPERIMRQYEHYKGHQKIFLCAPGQKRQYVFVHRLVAIAFIPNPDGLPVVDHRDENKKNNHHSNLKWTTAEENTSSYFGNRRQLDAVSNEPF